MWNFGFFWMIKIEWFKKGWRLYKSLGKKSTQAWKITKSLYRFKGFMQNSATNLNLLTSCYSALLNSANSALLNSVNSANSALLNSANSASLNSAQLVSQTQ